MKPRKRYNPRKHSPYQGTGIPPHIIAQAQAGKQPLDNQQIDNTAAPYDACYEAIRTGTMTDASFWQLIQTHYLYLHLIRAIMESPVRCTDAQTLLMARLELDVAEEEALHQTTEAIERIAERKQKLSRYIATGSELALLDTNRRKFRQFLELANTAHYMTAFRRAESTLHEIAHSHNKRIGATGAKGKTA